MARLVNNSQTTQMSNYETMWPNNASQSISQSRLPGADSMFSFTASQNHRVEGVKKEMQRQLAEELHNSYQNKSQALLVGP